MGLMTTTAKIGDKEITANCMGNEGSPVTVLVRLGNQQVEVEVADSPHGGEVRVTHPGDWREELGRSLILLGVLGRFESGQRKNLRVDEMWRERLGLNAGRSPDVVLMGRYLEVGGENAS